MPEVWALWEDLEREGQALFGLYASEQLANQVMSEEASHLFQPYVERIPVQWVGQIPGPKGAAEECSAERQRAPDRQPVAPAEGRAWETPATRTV